LSPNHPSMYPKERAYIRFKVEASLPLPLRDRC
jgi:hypothetical protein